MFIENNENVILYFDKISLEMSEILPFLHPGEREYCSQSQNQILNLNRAHQRFKVKEILGNFDITIGNEKLGRPTYDGCYDLAFSHKDDRYLIGLAKKPSKLGVDLENLNQTIDWSLYNSRYFTPIDLVSIKKFCLASGHDWNISNLLFFSLKESICKAKNIEFLPKTFSLIFDGNSIQTEDEKCSLHYSIQNEWLITHCLIPN